VVVSFIGGGNREYPEKTTLNHKKNDSINKQEKIKGLKYNDCHDITEILLKGLLTS
jgi:hypothetical protein